METQLVENTSESSLRQDQSKEPPLSKIAVPAGYLARRPLPEGYWEKFRQDTARIEAMLKTAGVTEEQINEDIDRLTKDKKR